MGILLPWLLLNMGDGIVPEITAPGVEYTLNGGRLHYTLTESRMHYRAPKEG